MRLGWRKCMYVDRRFMLCCSVGPYNEYFTDLFEGDPVICPTGNYCATLSTYVGCCELVSCIGVFTTCYDILGPICDASCQNNIGNLICQTHSYCAEYLYPGGSVGYGCQTVIGYTTSVLLSTVSNVGPLTTSEMTSQGPTVSTVSSSSSTSTSPTPTSTSVPTSGGNTLNGGSIAGITIGAITVLAIIFTLLWLLARRHTRGAHVHDGSEQLGRSNRTSTVTYQLQDQYGYGGQILSGAFAPFPKNDVRDERYYPTVPESQQAVSPGQEDGMESRQAMYPAGYSGPTMPEMPGLVPRTS